MIRILRESETKREAIFAREDPVANVEEPVRAILEDVEKNGDEALKRYTKEFDGADISTVQVGMGDVEEGFRRADPVLVEILFRAVDRIADFHRRQVRNSFLVNEEDGIVLGQKVLPLERVGLYVPGGTAAYPSSVLMNAIPAKIAGVKEICMVTPPGKDGKIPPNILAAAKVCGVDKVFRVGGAQAIAALAYGTESVPKVDKIVGPGNQYVAEAKKQVFGKVGIDMVAGPSEILVIADEKCDPRIVAADMLSQAEHDKNASAVLITDSQALAEAVQAALEEQIPQLKRAEIARASMTATARSSWRTPCSPASTLPTRSPRSTWSSAWTSPSPIWIRSKTPGPSSWVGTAPRRWETTLPGPTTPCPPAAPPGSPAPCRWTTS